MLKAEITDHLNYEEHSKKALTVIILGTGIYNWRKRYSGMDTGLLRRFKELEMENAEYQAHAC